MASLLLICAGATAVAAGSLYDGDIRSLSIAVLVMALVFHIARKERR